MTEPRQLAEHHRAMLECDSAIAPDLLTPDRYWTANGWPDLEGLGFRGTQKFPENFPALVVQHHGPDGEYTYPALRYDVTPIRKNGVPMKYISPAGVGLRLDVPLGCREGLFDPTLPLWFTEGARKADSLASVGIIAVNTPGVDGWRSPSAIRDLYGIPVKGREVVIAYDSDALTKREVRRAVEALVGWLQQKGAAVDVLDWRKAELP